MNQMADDLTNSKFDSFDLRRRICWNPLEQQWCVLDQFMKHAGEFHEEMKLRKDQNPPLKKGKRKRDDKLDPW